MRQHQLSILPIRVAFLGELSLDLACLLNPIQYALWEEGKPFESIGAQIFTAIERATALPIPGKSNKEAPSVAGMQSLFEATEADGEMLQQVSRIGATTVVEEPRQMGKSSLLARAFKTSTKPDEFWDSSLGAKENPTDFIEVAILAETSSPIWVMFDEADRLFNFPYRDDFFATLRGWHNLRARREHCRRFNLGIAHYSQRAIYSRRSQNLAGRMAKKAGTAIRRKWQDCTEVSDGAVKR